MVERSQQVRFPLESGHQRTIIGEAASEDLDGNLPFQMAIFGPIDLAHPSRTKQRKDLVRANVLPYERLPLIISQVLCHDFHRGFFNEVVRSAFLGQQGLEFPMQFLVTPAGFVKESLPLVRLVL